MNFLFDPGDAAVTWSDLKWPEVTCSEPASATMSSYQPEDIQSVSDQIQERLDYKRSHSYSHESEWLF